MHIHELQSVLGVVVVRLDAVEQQHVTGFGDMEFTTYITVIAGIFRTTQRLDEFKKFFEPKLPTPGLTREITMDTSVIASRVDLIQAEQQAVHEAVAKAVK